jgi:adenylosuccinate synthase
MGTYPYVTSSHPIAGGCCVGSGVGPTAITDIMGIFKSYTTRVGKGPFPTELFDKTGDYIRNAGGEFGTVTGRPRRTGWFDAVIARYAVRVNGLTEMVINKIDPLRGLDKLKVCVAYDYKGQRITEFPPNFADLEDCTPIYEKFDGFDEDITSCRTYDELPDAVKAYINALENICGCKVSMLGVGPARDQVIVL